ncbi:MAG: response regulator [Candidatus Aureabacteria bacterium]|nr:response regulator [Candidatus Auribacterota bacterium]
MAKILIIDDSLTITKTLEVFLKGKGHEILTAEDGETGLSMAKKHVPDLILLDIMLPKLNGYEVCNMLKMDAAYSHIKIIMFTAKVGEDSKTMSLETGADLYMTKDLDAEVVLNKVEELLKKKK